MLQQDDENHKKSNNINTARSAIIFFGFTLLCYYLLLSETFQQFIDLDNYYSQFIALLTSHLLKMAGIPHTHHETFLYFPSLTFNIIFACTGLDMFIIYTASVIASPGQWQRKPYWIVSGFFIIQIVNLLRLTGLSYVAVYNIRFFDYFHNFVFQDIAIIVILSLFFMYLNHTFSFKKDIVRLKIYMSLSIIVSLYILSLLLWLMVKDFYATIITHMASNTISIIKGALVTKITGTYDVITVDFTIRKDYIGDLTKSIIIKTSAYTGNTPMIFSIVTGLFPFIKGKRVCLFIALLVVTMHFFALFVAFGYELTEAMTRRGMEDSKELTLFLWKSFLDFFTFTGNRFTAFLIGGYLLLQIFNKKNKR